MRRTSAQANERYNLAARWKGARVMQAGSAQLEMGDGVGAGTLQDDGDGLRSCPVAGVAAASGLRLVTARANCVGVLGPKGGLSG